MVGKVDVVGEARRDERYSVSVDVGKLTLELFGCLPCFRGRVNRINVFSKVDGYFEAGQARISGKEFLYGSYKRVRLDVLDDRWVKTQDEAEATEIGWKVGRQVEEK